ncbi:hypothetical protein L7F22_026299 [Adiantum nelumboides]|nr:hypothetical protein [Adiantum nelumboides]
MLEKYDATVCGGVDDIDGIDWVDDIVRQECIDDWVDAWQKGNSAALASHSTRCWRPTMRADCAACWPPTIWSGRCMGRLRPGLQFLTGAVRQQAPSLSSQPIRARADGLRAHRRGLARGEFSSVGKPFYKALATGDASRLRSLLASSDLEWSLHGPAKARLAIPYGCS